jgi:hypothetical protein
MTDIEVHHSTVEIDQGAVLRSLNLNPRDPNTQALLLVCDRYGLDPVLKHMVLISGRPYVTRDGLLHVAHASGQFDGLTVDEEGEDTDQWWAKVSVYRKDMGRPFTYRGRYPKADAKHMAKFGPEMAVKVAEVMALRRAFSVTGIGTAEERWDAAPGDVIEAEPVEMATADQLDEIGERIEELAAEAKAGLAAWWKGEGFPPLTSGRLTVSEAGLVLVHLEAEDDAAELIETDAELVTWPDDYDTPTPSDELALDGSDADQEAAS